MTFSGYVFKNLVVLNYILTKMTITPREKVPESDDDPLETMLKKTGCIELHYKVQECIAETKDWRKCQNVVNDFRDCINKHKQDQMPQIKS